MKNKTELLKSFINKKHYSKSLTTPFYQNGRICATNSYIAGMIESIDNEGVLENKEAPDLSFIDFKNKNEIVFDIDYLYTVIKLFKQLKKGKNKTVTMAMGENSKVIKFFSQEFGAKAFIMPQIAYKKIN